METIFLPHILLHSTTKRDGAFDERFSDKEKIMQTRKRVCAQLEIEINSLVFADQQHNNNIAFVTRSNMDALYYGSTKRTQIGGIDGLITKEKNVFLVILTADCIPVFFFDPQKEIVGIAHCGWKGIYNGLAEKMVDTFEKQYGTSKKDLHIRFGASIGVCCYKVDKASDNRLNLFEKKFGKEVVREGNLDLTLSLKKQLIHKQITEEHITINSNCTCCGNNFFSWYREKPNLSGQQAHIIGIRG